jgi:hypothetical protein
LSIKFNLLKLTNIGFYFLLTSKNRRGRSFFWKPFFQKFVLAPPQEVLGDERWNEWYPPQVRLGRVRKARKSSIIQPSLLSMSIFWNSEKNRKIRGHPGGVRWWKNWLRGLFKQVRLGQVRKANKKLKKWSPGAPNQFVDLFWTKIQKNGFWNNDLVPKQSLFYPFNPCLQTINIWQKTIFFYIDQQIQ